MRTIRVAPSAHAKSMAGFTIVEMAVVLVIIGVILGAVMIGRDAQRNAEYLRIRQTFINQWAVAYNSYVQRTGVPFGDNRRTPRLMVNGTNYSGPTGGDLSAVTEPNAICQGKAGPGMRRGMESGAGSNLRKLMLDAGIELPQGRGVGMEDRYVYLDTNGNPQEIQVCFQWNRPGTPEGTGNVMVITGLIPDLARSLASAIKGNADASSGSFRQQSVKSGAVSSLEWIGDNQQAYAAGGTAGNGASDDGKGSGNREAQVMTVVAVYKMNQ